MTAHVAKPPMKSAVLFGWEDRNGLVPVYFKGQKSSDFLQDLVCTCKGKSVCMKGCICFEQSLSCIDPTNDMLQTHKPLNLNFGTFYEV
jgi:hypothetical protein